MSATIEKLGAMQLVITLTEDGGVRVDGPIENLIVAYGLLEVGRDAIYQNAQRATAARIKTATPADILQLKKVTQ